MEATLTIECAVCLETLGHNCAVVKPCSHQFCIECIESWLIRKHICPNCNSSVQTLMKLRDESEVEIPVTKYKPQQKQYHNYFKNEITKIKQRANNIQFQVQKIIKKKESDEIKSWALDTIQCRLDELLRCMQRLLPFELMELIDDLCYFEQRLNDVERGNLNKIKIEFYQSLDDTEDFYYNDIKPHNSLTYQNEILSKGINVKVQRNKKKSVKGVKVVS